MFSGEWINRIIGLQNVRVEVVMARAPDGSDMFEVMRFHSPSAGSQEPASAQRWIPMDKTIATIAGTTAQYVRKIAIPNAVTTATSNAATQHRRGQE